MFFTYLWRELRRRMRQAIFIAVGLALGIGLVITVTAASAGVKNAQASVLHSLHGVDTDTTVTKAPAAGANGNGSGFGFRQSIGSASRPKAGSKIDSSTLSAGGTLASISSAAELSGGQQQRVAIARALVKEPEVLLADEPAGNLDEDTRDETIGLLEKLWQDIGLTMVIVTHDSSIARRAQRLGTMRNGKLTVKQTV